MFAVKASNFDVEQVPMRLLDLYNLVALAWPEYRTVPQLYQGLEAKCRVDYTYALIAKHLRELAVMGAVHIEEDGSPAQHPAPATASQDDGSPTQHPAPATASRKEPVPGRNVSNDYANVPSEDCADLNQIRVTGHEISGDVIPYLTSFSEWLGDGTFGLDEYVDMLFERASIFMRMKAKVSLAWDDQLEPWRTKLTLF